MTEPIGTDREKLTDAQQRIYSFVVDGVSRGRCPTVREIGLAFGIGSPNGVLCHLRALVKKGWLHGAPAGTSRRYTLLGDEGEEFRLIALISQLPLDRLRAIARQEGLIRGDDRGEEEASEETQGSGTGVRSKGGRSGEAGRVGRRTQSGRGRSGNAARR